MDNHANPTASTKGGKTMKRWKKWTVLIPVMMAAIQKEAGGSNRQLLNFLYIKQKAFTLFQF
jgi:hypothetical protein